MKKIFLMLMLTTQTLTQSSALAEPGMPFNQLIPIDYSGHTGQYPSGNPGTTTLRIWNEPDHFEDPSQISTQKSVQNWDGVSNIDGIPTCMSGVLQIIRDWNSTSEGQSAITALNTFLNANFDTSKNLDLDLQIDVDLDPKWNSNPQYKNYIYFLIQTVGTVYSNDGSLMLPMNEDAQASGMWMNCNDSNLKQEVVDSMKFFYSDLQTNLQTNLQN